MRLDYTSRLVALGSPKGSWYRSVDAQRLEDASHRTAHAHRSGSGNTPAMLVPVRLARRLLLYTARESPTRAASSSEADDRAGRAAQSGVTTSGARGGRRGGPFRR